MFLDMETAGLDIAKDDHILTIQIKDGLFQKMWSQIKRDGHLSDTWLIQKMKND